LPGWRLIPPPIPRPVLTASPLTVLTLNASSTSRETRRAPSASFSRRSTAPRGPPTTCSCIQTVCTERRRRSFTSRGVARRRLAACLIVQGPVPGAAPTSCFAPLSPLYLGMNPIGRLGSLLKSKPRRVVLVGSSVATTAPRQNASALDTVCLNWTPLKVVSVTMGARKLL
jgi:hypothetical protein